MTMLFRNRLCICTVTVATGTWLCVGEWERASPTGLRLGLAMTYYHRPYGLKDLVRQVGHLETSWRYCRGQFFELLGGMSFVLGLAWLRPVLIEVAVGLERQ